MGQSEDLAAHATSKHDFYALLGLDGSNTETLKPHDIRRAHKKAALKWHPDKVTGSGVDPAKAAEKFHLIQIAYEVLSDAGVRAAYDQARAARVAREKHKQAYEGRRREMMEDLEKREKAHKDTSTGPFAGTKRSRDEAVDEDPEERLAREVRRLAEDGMRRRMQREQEKQRQNDEQNDKRSKEETEQQDTRTATGEPVQKQKPKGKEFESSTLARLRAAAASKKKNATPNAEASSTQQNVATV